MIRHSQQVISDPERGDGHDSNGRPGDCWKACIASLLDLPMESVPHFAELGDTWWEATQEFIETQKAGHELRWWEDILAVNVGSEFLIASGPSPRGDFQHAVIVDRAGQLVHDPHPSRAGLAGPASTFFGLRARAATVEGNDS